MTPNKTGKLFSVLLTLSILILCTGGPAAMAADSDQYEVLQARPDRLVVVLPNRMIIIAQEVRTAPVVSAQAPRPRHYRSAS